ncbi:hypothetical protein AVEN_35793-1 [Araneus ventricosus]|uniref:Peptidase A2 domain-containing protein n=1 Tax=Araneus ventricosus TaxID=182803 RepID=A0A4Y2BJU5_ARAVE|nr:hypothetical protein AVEN_35793-1 [Araneus ventricosus]
MRFISACISKFEKNAHFKVNAVTEEESISCLGNLKNASSEDKWRVNVLVDNKLLLFKIDTTADLTVISLRRYSSELGEIRRNYKQLEDTTNNKKETTNN